MKLYKRYVSRQDAYAHPFLFRHVLCKPSCGVIAVCSKVCEEVRPKIYLWMENKIKVYNKEGEQLIVKVCCTCIHCKDFSCSNPDVRWQKLNVPVNKFGTCALYSDIA